MDKLNKTHSELEKELADRNEELEAQREELTAAVDAVVKKNQYLESALEELNIINSEIHQIIYRTSHDLKSPVTSLAGLLNLMKHDPENVKTYVSKSDVTINSMNYVLKSLVLYSSNLVDEIRNDPLNLQDIWDDVLDEIVLIDGSDEIEISFKCDVRSDLVGDSERLKILFINLIKNSIDFRSENARVGVSLLSENDVLKIEITDNGIGIPEDIQNEVFDMFYRGNNKSKGSGLGLYFCKKTVDMLGGSIKLVSNLNSGTTVNIELPVQYR